MLPDVAAYLGRWVTVDAAAADAIRAFLTPCGYRRGEALFRVGDPVDDIVFLTEGLVRVFQSREGRDLNLRLLTAPSAALPYHSYLLSVPSDEGLEAITEVRGFRVRFRAFCAAHPGRVAAELQRVLAERHFLAMQRRVRMLQAGRAEHRYRVFLEEMEPDIIRLTPALHIASYLGITPESLSRLRARVR
jgi:CRP/FNR family transcriptional regulator, anaerobic regulatory protein